MTKLLVLGLLLCACLTANAQESSSSNQQGVYGATFDEVTVSSTLNVRRKSKEDRRPKELSNVPSGTTERSDQPTVSRLLSNDGSRVVPELRRSRRNAMLKKKLDLGSAEYLLHSRK